MSKQRDRWERPDFEERPLGAEVTAYLNNAQSLKTKNRPIGS
jgi:coenzyme PQQ precursor peptide PqqA